jgi:signal peptidase II
MIWFEAMLAAVLVMAGDQLSKGIVLSRRPAPAGNVRRPFFSIHCVLNARGALAPFLGVPALLALWAAAVFMAAMVLAYGVGGHDVLLPIGIGLVVGGAAGNVLDRLRRGAIVDFIAVGPWPVFNLADAAIVAGIGLIVLLSLS